MIWDIGEAKSQSEGKPPPESFAKIQRCGALQHLAVTEKVSGKRSRRTMLLTDGAKCYPKVCDQVGLLHEAVNHSKGEFVREVLRGSEKVSCHTGTIDATWTACKAYVPNSLSSQSPLLYLYVKSWQWRYILRQRDVETQTVRALRRR